MRCFMKYLFSFFYICFFLLGTRSALYAQQLARTADRQNVVSGSKITNKLQLKWKVQTGGLLYGSPIVYADKVFIGSCDSTLYALNKHDGSIIWRYKTGGEVRSTVAIDQQMLFFLSSDGIFYALDVHSGTLLWTFETQGERTYDTWDYFQSSPAVEAGTVFFGSGDHHVYALDAKSGKLIWKFKTGGIVHAAPTVTAKEVMVGSFDGYFYCLEKNGDLRWKFKTIGEHYFPKGEIQFHAVAADSSVYFGSRDFNMYALKIKDGTGHWVYHQPGSWTSAPSLAGKKMIVTMSDSYSVLVLDPVYGGKIAEPAVPLNVFSSASISDSVAYFGALDGTLYQIDLLKGEVSPVFQLDLSKKNSAHFFDEEGKLKSDLQDRYGHDIHKLFRGYLEMGSIFSTVWIDDATLYFGAADGAIYALQ